VVFVVALERERLAEPQCTTHASGDPSELVPGNTLNTGLGGRERRKEKRKARVESRGGRKKGQEFPFAVGLFADVELGSRAGKKYCSFAGAQSRPVAPFGALVCMASERGSHGRASGSAETKQQQ